MFKKNLFLSLVICGSVLGIVSHSYAGAPKEKSVFEGRNKIYVVLTDPQGDIFNPAFMKVLRNVTEEIFYLPGVDRPGLVSLTMNNTMNFRDVMEDGFEGGTIIPENFEYSSGDYAQIKENVLKSPYVGQLVSFDLASAMIVVPFFSDTDGQALTRDIEKILPDNSQIRFFMIGYAPFSVELKKEIQRSLWFLILSIAGALVLFLVSKRERVNRIYPDLAQSTAGFALRRYIYLLILLTAGLGLAMNSYVGNRGSGPTLLNPDTAYQKAQKAIAAQFFFSMDSIIVLAKSPKGCTDPATVAALDQFHWFVSGLPGVKSVRSLSETVKKLNAFYHENNLKWRVVPREQEVLIAATSLIEPKTGMLDDSGLIMPVLIFLKDHDPRTLLEVREGIRSFRSDPGLVSFHIAGGVAEKEALINEKISSLIKIIICVVLTLLFLITRLLLPFRQTVDLCFLFCIILTLTAGVMSGLGIGLNIDTLSGVGLGAAICFCFLIRNFLRVRAGNDGLILLILGFALSGGLLSNVNFIFRPVLIIEIMLILTWLMRVRSFPAKAGPAGPSVKI